MYEYRQLIYRLRVGQSARSISEDTGFGRNKLKEIKLLAEAEGWLSSDVLPEESVIAAALLKEPTARPAKRLAEPYADCIQKWCDENLSATVIHQFLVKNHQYRGSYNSVQRFIQQYKAEQATKLTVPLHFLPAEAAQVDFGKGPTLYDERVGREVDTWFFVMTLCWSHHQYAELISHQDIENWLNCHQNAFEWFGGVVSKIIIDNPKCAITKACYCDSQVQRSYSAFAQEYGFIISACPPREPKKKGRVEAGVKYVKGNFLPLRQFQSLQDANKQLGRWVLETEDNRKHGSVFEKPLTRFEEIERHQLKPLPQTRPEIASWHQVMLYTDCHIRYRQCRYSAPYQLYGETLWAKVTTSFVIIYHQHQEVAVHPRLFKPGDTQTNRGHLPPQANIYFTQDNDWCLSYANEIGEHCRYVIETLLTDPVRDLLRQAQKILSLTKQFGQTRLENACRRAVMFHAINYNIIQKILKEGLDTQTLNPEQTFEQLHEMYQGKATFQRNLSTTQH
jgi:transposase